MVATTVRNSVKMVHAALDEERETGSIILRGVVSPESLEFLKVAPYQREILPQSKIRDLKKAFEENASLPDIDLGMRGGSFTEREGAFYLQDDIYIVDGLQRVTAAKVFLKDGKQPRLGAVVHFNTNEKWERDRFRVLNTMRAKLSSNILIRNSMPEYPVVEMMYNLTKDSSFVLHNRICWNQRMKRDELITATTFLRAATMLHSKLQPGLSTYAWHGAIPVFQKAYDKLGRSILRENIKAFWSTLDDCFKINLITFKEGSTPIKSGFLETFAKVLSDHSNFWRDTKLFIDADMKRKISIFPVNDPEIARLASAGGSASDILYQLLVKHINSGKKKYKLNPYRKNVKKEVA